MKSKKQLYQFYRLGPESITAYYHVDDKVIKQHFLAPDGIIDQKYYESIPEVMAALRKYDNNFFTKHQDQEYVAHFRSDLLTLVEKHGIASAYTLLASTYNEHDIMAGLFHKAAELGDLNGMGNYGQMLFFDYKVEEGRKWIERSAQLGDQYSMRYLAISYLFGTFTEVDMDKAAELFRKLISDHKDYYAFHNLGVMYIDANYFHTALRLFEMAEKPESRESIEDELTNAPLPQNLEHCKKLLDLPVTERRKHAVIQYFPPEFHPFQFLFSGGPPEGVGANNTSPQPLHQWKPNDNNPEIDKLDIIEHLNDIEKPQTAKRDEDFVFPMIRVNIANKMVLSTQHELIFLEKNIHLELNQYIQRNIGKLRDMFIRRQYVFIYLPYYRQTDSDVADIIGSYVREDLNFYGGRHSFFDQYKTNENQTYYTEQTYWDLLMSNADFPQDCAGFLRYRPNREHANDYASYDYILFPHRPGTDWDKAFATFAQEVSTIPFVDIEKPLLPHDTKLAITNNYDIYLVANDKQMITEVEMTALPKALYILFLRHPDGIAIKNLYSYRTELADIYRTISNRKNIDNSIEMLTDPTNNSANEKISRIKQAFEKVLKGYDTDINLFVPVKDQQDQEYIVELDRRKIIWKTSPEAH